MFVKMISEVKDPFGFFEGFFLCFRFGFWTTFLKFINGFGDPYDV